MKLNFLTNEKLVLQTKIRYFADYFQFVNEHLGRLPTLPFENPISLLDKIQFQVESNIERCPKSIDAYLMQLDYYPYKLTKEISKDYKGFIISFKRKWKLLKTDTERKKWLKGNDKFLASLTKVKAEISENLFEFIHKALYTYIVCDHPLSKHKRDIRLLTEILITIFRFKGFTKDQVSKYVDRILTKNKYEFPLPITILSQVKSDSFEDLRKNFIENRDFKSQFEGIKNILDAYNSRSGFFIFPISGVQLRDTKEKNIEITFDKVTFYNSEHPIFESLDKNVKKKDQENKYVKLHKVFFTKNRILGVVKLNYEKREDTAKLARAIVLDELGFLSAYFKSSNLTIINNDFLWTDSFEAETWWGKISVDRKHIGIHFPSKYEIQDAESNPYILLNGNKAKSAQQILYNEKIFLKAYLKDDISSYWLYIENVFWKKNLEKRKVRSGFKSLAELVVPELLEELSFSLRLMINDFNIADPENFLGLSKKQVNEITVTQENMSVAKEFNWDAYLPRMKHDFLKDAVRLYINLKSKSNQYLWSDYFIHISQELSDFRNSQLHTGFFNESSRVKLTFILPYLMNRIKWNIINFANEHPEKTYDEIIEALIPDP